MVFRKFVPSVVVLVISLLVSQSVLGQGQLAQKDKAVVAFDLQVEKLLNSKTAKALGIEALIDEAKKDLEGIDPKDIVRVSGAVSAPANMAEVKKLGEKPDPLPLNFFVRIQFSKPEAQQAIMEMLKAEGKPIVHKGKTYYRPPANTDAPKNLVAHDAGNNILEIGTDAFILHSDRRNTFTQQLAGEFGKTPNDTIRLAMDVNGTSNLLNEAIEAGKAANPQIGMFGNVAKQVKALRFSADFETASLLTLTVTSNGGDGTKRLKEGLDAILALAQFGGKDAVGKMPEGDLKKVATQVLSSLKTTQKGDEITVSIPRPDGLVSALKGLMQTN